MFKKSTTKQSKAIWALSVALIALVALTSAITFAYFTDKIDQKESSQLTFGTLNIDIDSENPFGASISETTCTNVVPGCTIELAGKVTNASTIDSYVRLTILPDVELATAVTNGKEESAITTIKDTLATAINTSIKTKLESAGFIQGTDGFYIKVASSTTEIIDLSSVTFELSKTALGNDYQGAKIKFKLDVAAIQAKHSALDGANITTSNVENLVADNAWDAVNGVYNAG